MAPIRSACLTASYAARLAFPRTVLMRARLVDLNFSVLSCLSRAAMPSGEAIQALM